ncbi:hypothetical protein DT23_17585 [Thioclava indica]|uniref:Uncharacterized protein n=1 Tax=Thioclava indica TaxID=1353528 RepID=A0A074K5E2_9RHOB|nr:hypothetical protein DT23_17585 [Thioclava indica]
MTSKNDMTTWEWPEPSKALLDQLMNMDSHIIRLFPLLDLLNQPEGEEQGLVERLMAVLEAQAKAQEAVEARLTKVEECLGQILEQKPDATPSATDTLLKEQNRMLRELLAILAPIRS